MNLIENQAHSIFLTAIDRAPDEWPSFLDEACGTNVELRARIDQLLQLHQALGSIRSSDGSARIDSIDDSSAADVPSLLANAAALPPSGRDYLEEGAQWCRKVRRLVRAPGTTLSQPSDLETASDFFSPAIMPGVSFGRFQVIRELGRGAFGVVFLAFDPSLGREVALKVPRPDVLVSPGLRARFRQEARAAAGLDHPNLVPVYEVGEEGLICYIASGYCPGITLSAWLKQRTEPVPYRQAAYLLTILADAVAHAHERGVVHRDLKPGNILLQKDGEARTGNEPDETPTIVSRAISGLLDPASSLGFQPKITDFGLAKLVEGNGSGEVGQTQTGAIMGTPSYMAPEQAEAKKAIGPAADIYALGAILYEQIAGRPPFVADSTLEVLLLVRNEEPLAPSRLRPKLPRDLETICLKCLQKEPSRRYTSARELVGDLRRYLAGEPIQARPVGTIERLMKWTRRRPAVAALLAGLVLAFLGTVVGLVVLSDAWEKEATARQIAERQKEEARYNEYVAEMNLAQREYEANNLGHVRELLEAQVPNEPGAADWRGFEWDYWQHMAHRELLTLEGHRDSVNNVSFSPDGRRLASASNDRTVRIWDADTGQELHTLEGHTDMVRSVSFSPDGRLLASASEDRTLHLCDASTGQKLRVFKGHTREVSFVSFSPDGRLLASASMDSTARLWDVATGQVLFTLKGHTQFLGGSFSPDGRRLALAGMDPEPTLLIWDPASGKELLILKGHKDTIRGVSYSPDGRRLASASEDQMVKVWDATTGKELLSFKGHTGIVYSVVFSPDGRQLASVSADHTVRVWDADTGQELLTLKGHTSAVLGLSFSPDGRRLASACADHTVRIWDAVPGHDLFTLKGHAKGVRVVTFSPDGRRLASAGHDRRVQVWDATTGLRQRTLTGHKDIIYGLSFSSDGRWLASASQDGSVRVWDVASGQELVTLPGHIASHCGVAFRPDDQRLAIAEHDRLRVWDPTAGKELLTFKGHTAEFRGVSFSPDGRRLASASSDHTVRVWDADTGQELLTLNGHTSTVFAVFSPDGRRLASMSSDSSVRLWDAVTGQELLALRGHTDAVFGVSFSPDGRRLASASADQTVRLWDTATGKELLALKGHTRQVWGVSFSPDGRRLASASQDGTVRIWEIAAVPDAVWRQRDLASQVNSLFAKLLFREEVVSVLCQDVTLSETERQLALEMARESREDPSALNNAAWHVAVAPGGSKDAYAQALHQAEAAARLAPKDGLILNTLGVAQYRAGRYAEALPTLTRSAQFNSLKEGATPEDLAFLAMTQHQLGRTVEAMATLSRLQEMKKQPGWELEPGSTAWLHEAEELIEGKSAGKGP